MSNSMIIESIALATVAFALVKFGLRQYRALKRVERGVRLVNYIVDRRNEREALARLSSQGEKRSHPRSI